MLQTPTISHQRERSTFEELDVSGPQYDIVGERPNQQGRNRAKSGKKEIDLIPGSANMGLERLLT